MSENEVATITLDAVFKIHKELGPGLFEAVYESIMEYELVNTYYLNVKRQTPIPVTWKTESLDLACRADMIVEDLIKVEFKSIESIAPVHLKQVGTYLKLTGLRLVLLINFNAALLKDGIERIVNKL